METPDTIIPQAYIAYLLDNDIPCPLHSHYLTWSDLQMIGHQELVAHPDPVSMAPTQIVFVIQATQVRQIYKQLCLERYGTERPVARKQADYFKLLDLLEDSMSIADWMALDTKQPFSVFSPEEGKHIKIPERTLNTYVNRKLGKTRSGTYRRTQVRDADWKPAEPDLESNPDLSEIGIDMI